MHPKLRYLNTVMLILLAFSMLSCQQHIDTSKKNFHLNYSSGTLETIDPAFAKDLYIMWTCHAIYNTLLETDEHLNLVPSLARSWDISADKLTYTFHLRNDVYFQDNPLFPSGKGRHMTAADVVYSFKRLIDPKVASRGAWIFNERIAEHDPFVALDDTTVQVRLNKPFFPMLQMLSMTYCSIVPHEVADHWAKDFRSHPCGTGPFIFNYWDEGNTLILHRNPHYWERDSNGASLPYLDAIQIGFIDSKATEFFLFLQGKVDFVNNIDGSFKDLILAKDGTLKKEYQNKFSMTKSIYLNTEYIGFLTDTLNPLLDNMPTRNPLVRQAMNYAIDRNKIITYFRNGMGMPATGGFIPIGMPGFDSTRQWGYTYDPAKAAQLLAAAGYPNGKGLTPVRILTPDNYVDIVNFVVTQLQDVGIPVQIETIQPQIMRQQMSSAKALMFRTQWIADYPDAETFLSFFYSPLPAPPNYTRFKNATFDEWYEQSVNLPDSLRWSLYHKMDSLAMSYAPVIPLFYDQMLHFTQNKITGFTSNPMNIIDLKKVRIKK